MRDELAPPTRAHEIEFRVYWWIGSFVCLLGELLMKALKRHG